MTRSLSPAGKSFLAAIIVLTALAAGTWLFLSLRPAALPFAAHREFRIAPGEGIRTIARDLQQQGIIRSALGFEAYAVLTQRSKQLKPGRYDLDPSASGAAIVAEIVAGPAVDIAVTVPEGLAASEIDPLLAAAGVTKAGEFLAYAKQHDLEGRLFPDTYRFYFDSTPQAVADKMTKTFDAKAGAALAADLAHADRDLVLASMLEKEVPEAGDRRIVAGILLKRAAAGMPLQVDATVCYAKRLRQPAAGCNPLTAEDFKLASPYNTYAQPGFPPGPIGNPGLESLDAAMHPQDSAFWYYLSDPKTGKTVFAKTLEEQAANRAKYLP